jgi:serine/threonine protein kinase
MTQLTGTSKSPRREYAAGDVIGSKYSLLRLLGEGGMGSVWVAENMALKANVALKLIRADVAEASANERFLSEARLAARLQHAAIVRVFDFGKTEQDEPFIVMELLDGETLGQRLSRMGAIDPTDLCQTLLPIIDALHSAHGHGVIHRDLKPDNVFIAKADGGGVQPKLLDFGIAKLRGESAFHTTKLTQAGTLIGSPDYMSPEQARGETDLDPRSDVWALCVLAYECLVGKPPFHGDNYNALLWAIIHDEPVPITVFQAGDSELWRILKTGFAKDRNVRWESARKLGEALAAWLESHGVVEDVCNRSLHASWLPAERPTRPEMAQFDLSAPPTYRTSMHDASPPPPTLTAMRRPHAMSLWFAGLGLVTLLGAWFLSRADVGVPSVMDADGRQQVGALLPTPGPAPETRSAAGEPQLDPTRLDSAGGVRAGTRGNVDPSGIDRGTLSRGALGRVNTEEPIGTVTREEVTTQPSSWKDNHGAVAHPSDEALAQEVRNGVMGTNRPAAGDTSRPHPAKPAAAKAAPASGSSKPKPRAAKKAPGEPPSSQDNEVDFGI